MDTRAWRADFNVADSEGRIVSGIAVPYGSPTQIAERGLVFEETFAVGSMKESIAKRGDRIKVLGFHDSRAMPLGKPIKLDEQHRGLYMEARISDTTAGNEAITLIRDGVLDGFSVGFSVPEGGDSWNDAQTERSINRANLHEVSLVNFPAYDRARVEAVRAADGGPNDATDPHQFNDNVGTGLCGVCNMTDAAGPHTDPLAGTEEQLAEILAMQTRLDVLRLTAIALPLR